jgi:hypothetical protein
MYILCSQISALTHSLNLRIILTLKYDSIMWMLGQHHQTCLRLPQRSVYILLYIYNRIISCGYWDNTIKVHALDSLKEVASAHSGHIGEITCVQLGYQGGHTLISGVRYIYIYIYIHICIK